MPANFKEKIAKTAFFIFLFISCITVVLFHKKLEADGTYLGILTLLGESSLDLFIFAACLELFASGSEQIKDIFKYFSLSFLCAFFSDLSYNLTLNVLKVSEFSNILQSLFDVPFLFFLLFQLIAWLRIVRTLNLKSTIDFKLFAAVPIFMATIFIFFIFVFVPAWKVQIFSMPWAYQILDSLIEIVTYAAALVCLGTSRNKVISLMSLGSLIVIASDFSIRYNQILSTLHPNSFFEITWIFGLMLFFLGVSQANTQNDFSKVQNWLLKPDSIRFQITSFSFSLCILSISFIFLLIYYFSSSREFSEIVSIQHLPSVLIIFSVLSVLISNLFSSWASRPFGYMSDLIKKTRTIDLNQTISLFPMNFGISEFHDLETCLIDAAKNYVEKTEAQKKLASFGETAAKVAHDIKSPVYSLKILFEESSGMPAENKIAMSEAITRIQDIANELLNQYGMTEKTKNPSITLISSHIQSVISEKKTICKNQKIRFNYQETIDSAKCFVKLNASDFKRAISNILNNSIEALSNIGGKIDILLTCDEKFLQLTITDDGIGISPSSLEKIICDESFTNGKVGGHGLGLSQVKEMLKKSNGLLSIQSTLHIGTKATLKFPKCKNPFWLPDKLHISEDKLIIVLDDDPSIHKTWKIKLRKFKNTTIKNFIDPIKAMEFIEAVEDKTSTLFLADYHLSNSINGVELIKKSEIKHSILVTTNYSDESIINDALFFGFKILPKALLHSIEILMDNSEKISKIRTTLNPDLIIIDDNKSFAETLIRYRLRTKNVIFYEDPVRFLEEFHLYDKNVPICADYNLEITNLDGIKLLEKLNKEGFNHLWLSSGTIFQKKDLPEFVRFIEKHQIYKIVQA